MGKSTRPELCSAGYLENQQEEAEVWNVYMLRTVEVHEASWVIDGISA